MGFQFLNFISAQCQSLSATASPTINAIGLHVVIALATIMLAWFGVQEALASAQGGPGFNVAKFLNFFLLITFAYCFVRFYDSTIPGVGYSLKSFISEGTTNLADIVGHDATASMMQTIDESLKQSGPGMAMFTAPYMLVAYIVNQVSLAVLAALISVVIAYGEIAATIVGLLGPVFIPFLAFDKLAFLFWGWLKAYLSFAFYKVVAAATLGILGHLFMSYSANLINFSNPITMLQNFPFIVGMTIVNIYMLLKIPVLTASIFSGHTGGHDGGTGMIQGFAAARLLR